MKWKMFLNELWEKVKAFGKKRVDIVWFILAFVLVGFWQNDVYWQHKHAETWYHLEVCAEEQNRLRMIVEGTEEKGPKAGEEIPITNDED